MLQKQIREAYENLTGENIVHIDNNCPIENTLAECIKVIDSRVFNK